MLPAGQISHAIPGRFRARIPARKGDERFFVRVREELEQEPGISGLKTNPLTASVLVLHHLDTDRVAAIVESRGLFHVERGSQVAAHAAAGRSSLFGSFLRIHPSSQHEWFALALIGLAAFETMEGNVAAPAITLLWYAFRLLEERRVIASVAPTETAPTAVN